MWNENRNYIFGTKPAEPRATHSALEPAGLVEAGAVDPGWPCLHVRPPLPLAQVLQPLLLAQVWQVGLESSPLLEIRGSRRGIEMTTPLCHTPRYLRRAASVHVS